MTVSLAPTQPSAAPSKPAEAAAPKDAEKFGQMVKEAGACVAAAIENAVETSEPVKQTDATLEALLQSLRTTLTPGANLVATKVRGKAGDEGKAPAETKAEDGDEDAVATPIPFFSLAQLLPAVAAAKADASTQPVDDVLSKASGRPALPVIDPATLAALTQTADLPKFDLSAITAPAQPSPVDARIDRLVDTARDAAWLDRLSQDIAASAGSGDKLKFRMMPPNLGALEVSVERQAAGMNVTMTTHTADARNLIADSRQQMVDSLKAQGVPLVQLSLATAGEEAPGHRPPTFFNSLIETVPASGTDLAAQPVESTTARRVGRFA